jgi:hypothetical protein
MANYVLEILDGDRAGDVVPVAERALRIGRKPGNDVILADEKTSGVHCEVAPEGDRHVLRDLGSTNGTFLDGKRVTELVLTPGDVITVGRLRVKFRDAAAEVVDAGDLAVRRLDAARLKPRGGSAALLVAVLVLVAAGGGVWYWLQGTTGGEGGGGPAAAARRAPIDVPGNRLAAAVAGCESDEGFDLRAVGAGFSPSPRAHTGSLALQAALPEGVAGPDFALLRLREPLPVLTGRTLTLAAHVRTTGGAQAALRAVFSSSNEAVPFRFCTGTPIAAASDWQRLEVVAAVPSGCDRLQLEAVAVLPSPEAECFVDDVAIVEAGQAEAIEVRLAESGQTAFGTGSSIVVRSTDTENPATLLDVRPATVPAALEPLHRAEQCVLSDLGASLQVTASQRSFTFVASNVADLQFVFPAEAAGGLLVQGEDGLFQSAPAAGDFTARGVLVGDRSTRALLTFASAVPLRGRIGAGRYRLTAATASVELVLGFLAERQQAGEFLRRARAERADGRPGAALDALRELQRSVPMDSETLAAAQALRAELLAEQAEAMAALQQDLEEAAFFTTRGGFERVVEGVERQLARFGQHNLEDPAGLEQLLATARENLARIDAARQGRSRERLLALASAFADAQMKGLEKLVEQYVRTHLPAANAPAGGAQDRE